MTINTGRNLPALVPQVPNAGEQTVTKMNKPPNQFISQAQWDKIQKAGGIAIDKLLRLLVHPSFNGLPVKDQLRIITMATDLAFKPNAALIRVDVHAPSNEPEAANALKSLANKSLELPELTAARARAANENK